MNEKIVSALVGLAGACSNNGKSTNTDNVVIHALLNVFHDTDEDAIVSEIRREKFTIAPNCETCSTPCGNTSDYDMNKFHKNEELGPVKLELLHEIVGFAERVNDTDKNELPEKLYHAISYFGYELTEDYYKTMIDSIKQMEA